MIKNYNKYDIEGALNRVADAIRGQGVYNKPKSVDNSKITFAEYVSALSGLTCVGICKVDRLRSGTVAQLDGNIINPTLRELQKGIDLSKTNSVPLREIQQGNFYVIYKNDSKAQSFKGAAFTYTLFIDTITFNSVELKETVKVLQNINAADRAFINEDNEVYEYFTLESGDSIA